MEVSGGAIENTGFNPINSENNPNLFWCDYKVKNAKTISRRTIIHNPSQGVNNEFMTIDTTNQKFKKIIDKLTFSAMTTSPFPAFNTSDGKLLKNYYYTRLKIHKIRHVFDNFSVSYKFSEPDTKLETKSKFEIVVSNIAIEDSDSTYATYSAVKEINGAPTDVVVHDMDIPIDKQMWIDSTSDRFRWDTDAGQFLTQHKELWIDFLPTEFQNNALYIRLANYPAGVKGVEVRFRMLLEIHAEWDGYLPDYATMTGPTTKKSEMYEAYNELYHTIRDNKKAKKYKHLIPKYNPITSTLSNIYIYDDQCVNLDKIYKRLAIQDHCLNERKYAMLIRDLMKFIKRVNRNFDANIECKFSPQHIELEIDKYKSLYYCTKTDELLNELELDSVTPDAD